MRKLIPALMLAVLILASCAAHVHVVGEGAQGMTMSKARQFYVIDLAPLNEVDTRAMAGDAADYTIKTEASFVDGLISVLALGIITVRTVTVTK